jgi:tetratricopeptide (TPR) repeat protein
MTILPRTRGPLFAARALLLLAALAVLGGCGGGDLADRYAAEKLAWQAMKLSRAMRSNPELATDEMRGRLADTYRRIIRSFPPPADAGAMTDLEREVADITARSRSRLALLALDRDDTDEAIRLYASIRDSYAFDAALAMDGAFALAGIYERVDRWEDAISAYEEVLRRWESAEVGGPDPDPQVLRIPIRIATGHVMRGEDEAARRRLAAARARYAEWEDRWAGSAVARLAAELSAETYTLEGRWQDAVAAYEAFDREYGDASNRGRVWMTLADLYETRLGEPLRADQYYSRVVEAYRDENAGGTAAIALAAHDIDRGDYEQARERLADVISRFRHEEALGATASHYVALSYEREGRWDSAVPALNNLASTYPTTMYGLSALLRVAEHFQDAGEADAAETALERAAEHYERVARDYADTPAELAARNYLIETRRRQERWPEAVDALLETARRYPDSPASPSMVLQAAEIVEEKLGDPDRARSLRAGVRRAGEGGDAAEEGDQAVLE